MKNFSLSISLFGFVLIFGLGAIILAFIIEGWHSTRKSAIQYSTAKSVIVSDLVSIEELQKAINDNKEMFIDDGVIVGPNYVVLVDKEKLSIQVVQSPVKSISNPEKINPTPAPKQTDDAGSIGAEP